MGLGSKLAATVLGSAALATGWVGVSAPSATAVVLTGDGSNSCDIVGGTLNNRGSSLLGEAGYECDGINAELNNLTDSEDAEKAANEAFLGSEDPSFPDPQEDGYTELEKIDEDEGSFDSGPLEISVSGSPFEPQQGSWKLNLNSEAFQVDLDGDGSSDAIRNDIVIGLSGGNSNSLYRIQLDKFSESELRNELNATTDDEGNLTSVSGDWDTAGLVNPAGNRPDLSNARALGRYSMGLPQLDDEDDG